MSNTLNRRDFLKTGAAAGIASGATATVATAQETPLKYQGGKSRWPLCMNTSTIRPASLDEKIRVTAEAGYDMIELWMNDLEDHEKNGGSVKDVGKKIKDLGLSVIDVIGLWDCLPGTREEFDQMMPTTENRIRLAAEAGAKHVATLPLPNREGFDFLWATDRYREILNLGREKYGILPAFEYVSLFKTVPRFGMAAQIAIDVNDKDAKLVMDTFHMYKSGSGFEGVRHISGTFIATFHWNDAPADPVPAELGDKHRLLPGDGIFPLVSVLEQLKAIHYEGPLSLELFNQDLWAKPAIDAAKIGIERMMTHVAQVG